MSGLFQLTISATKKSAIPVPLEKTKKGLAEFN
jgi:hypothetical protein